MNEATAGAGWTPTMNGDPASGAHVSISPDDSIWLYPATKAELYALVNDPVTFAKKHRQPEPVSKFRSGVTIIFNYDPPVKDTTDKTKTPDKYIVQGLHACDVMTVRTPQPPPPTHGDNTDHFALSIRDAAQALMTGGAKPRTDGGLWEEVLTKDKFNSETLYEKLADVVAPKITLLENERLGYVHLHLGAGVTKKIMLGAITLGGSRLPESIQKLKPESFLLRSVGGQIQTSAAQRMDKPPKITAAASLRFVFDWSKSMLKPEPGEMPRSPGDPGNPCGKLSGAYDPKRNELVIDTMWYTMYAS